MYLFSAITQVPYPRATTALVAATFAVLLDLIFRFRDYRDLLHSLPVLGYMKFSGILTLVSLQVVALFYLITLLPGSLRAVVILLSAFVVIIQLSYWRTLSQFMTGTDLFLAVTVSGDHRVEAISSFFKPLVLLYALPYALILSVLILVPSRSALRLTLALSFLPALYLLVSNYALFLYVPERSFHLNPLTSFLRSTLHWKFENLRGYRGPRDDLPPFHVSQRPLDSIIYVIDESVRGSNLSLNGYPRATTPFLQSLETQGLLKNLGICVAAGSFSHISNAYLITGHNAFPDNDFRTDKNPTIFDYAKKMGYETIYIDINRVYLSSLMNVAGEGFVRSLDQWMTDQSFEERHINLDITKDLGVARVLSSLLNDKGGYFILVNKKGLHFHYCNKYPDDMDSTIWKPVMKSSESIDPSPFGREKLVNTYDNGIRFQVDEFFREFVSETTNQNYVILYTSDHGQTLAEHGQMYTHMKPDKVIVDVPEFLLVGERYGQKNLLAGIPPSIRVSHLNNFSTLLDLMGVPMSLRVSPYDKSIFSLTAEDNRVRYYMSGSLHGFGDYVVKMISTPPDEGWGVSRPVGNGPKFE
ncbi:MAG: sulfatase-like hydrolase/transferase [Thermodesulfobacteriota bacterium]|jgi:lipid A ethanolaminephosphotransferase|nr:MAG: sulfatase-like hydrolase/transferase [Thermodesulfobacteriota bacterium]